MSKVGYHSGLYLEQHLPSVTTSSCRCAKDYRVFAALFDDYTYLSQLHQFSSIMKFIIFFVYVPFVYSEFHTSITTYTEINGWTIAGIPEFSAVTTLDEQQIDYYDSEIKKLIPRQDWMKEFTSGDRFKEYTKIRERVQQTNKINITVLMERFSHSQGIHTYQRFHGCGWDDETGDSQGFDQHGYDGEDFISLDVKELTYMTPVLQGVPTLRQWNNDRKQLELLKQYYKYDCVNWLKYFLTLKKADSERRAPEVSLLQKSSSSPVECHATGFYPSAVTITWLRHGQELDVDLGETLPNEDGTFQRTLFFQTSGRRTSMFVWWST